MSEHAVVLDIWDPINSTNSAGNDISSSDDAGINDAVSDGLANTFDAESSGRGSPFGEFGSHSIQESTEQEVTVIGYMVMGGFLVVLILCMILLFYKLWSRYRMQFYDQTDSDEGYQYPSGRATKQRIQRRYETVEHWVISKTVQPHDAFCDAVTGNFSHHNHLPTQNGSLSCTPPPSHSASGRSEVGEGEEYLAMSSGNATDEAQTSFSSTTTAAGLDEQSTSVSTSPPISSPVITHKKAKSNVMEESDDDIVQNEWSYPSREEVRECPICMSELKVGQIVSWSANANCRHVFHHECIKEWLLRHIDCCLCKNVYLPVDEKRGKAKTEALNELSHRYAAAAATSFYCVETGLVRIPKTVRCTRNELKQLECRIFDGAVQPSDLVGLRGSRVELSVIELDDPCHIVELDCDGDTDPTVSNNTSFETTLCTLDEQAVHQAPNLIGPSSSSLSLDEQLAQQYDLELGGSGSGELVAAADWLQHTDQADIGDPRFCIQATDDETDGIEVLETTSHSPIVEAGTPAEGDDSATLERANTW